MKKGIRYNITCGKDEECPHTAVCGASGNCLSPYDLTHSCGGNNAPFCGPAASCQNEKCKPLYNIGKACTNDTDCCEFEMLSLLTLYSAGQLGQIFSLMLFSDMGNGGKIICFFVKLCRLLEKSVGACVGC